MFIVTTEQMNKIHASMSQSLEEQNTVFESLELSSNDYEWGDDTLDALCAVSRDQMDIEDVTDNPLDYLSDLSEDREKELKAGAKITEEELEEYCQKQAIEDANSGCATFSVLVKFNDGERQVFGIFIDEMFGQGGNAFIDFYGFFETEEAADTARDNIKEYIVV
jgi:hypothetical protein